MKRILPAQEQKQDSALLLGSGSAGNTHAQWGQLIFCSSVESTLSIDLGVTIQLSEWASL